MCVKTNFGGYEKLDITPKCLGLFGGCNKDPDLKYKMPVRFLVKEGQKLYPEGVWVYRCNECYEKYVSYEGLAEQASLKEFGEPVRFNE